MGAKYSPTKTVPQALLRSLVFLTLSLLILLPSLSVFAESEPTFLNEPTSSVATFKTLLESPEIISDLESKSFGDALGKVHSINHYVQYENGRKIFVTEYFSLRSVLRRPARAVIFLTGPEFRGNFWSIPVEGYNGPEMAAERGFFAYTVDYVGVGESFLPGDGTRVNFMTQVPAIRTLVDSVRRSRRVQSVDLVAEAYGGEVASQLADEPQRVRSVTMSTVVYKNYSPGFLSFFSPGLENFLRNQPGGYWQPNFLNNTLAASTNEALREYVISTQLNTYPTGPYLEFWDFGLPAIDAAAARVPCLVVTGEFNPFPAVGDLEELVSDWGGGGELVVISGASYSPRIGSEEIAEQYFEALFNFIDVD